MDTFDYICWRALARQLPTLYNSENEAKSVRCKIEDMRSQLCFLYLGILGCLWMHMEISSNSLAQPEKGGEICMPLITCGSIHEGHEWFSYYSRGRQEIFVFGCTITWAILPIREQRCQDIDQVLLREIIFFCLSVFWFRVFSSIEVFGKITSIRSKLPTAACWSREEKRGNCEANLL